MLTSSISLNSSRRGRIRGIKPENRKYRSFSSALRLTPLPPKTPLKQLISLKYRFLRPFCAQSDVQSCGIRRVIALPIYTVALILSYLSDALGNLAAKIAGDDRQLRHAARVSDW
jgi:hypothetical protein